MYNRHNSLLKSRNPHFLIVFHFHADVSIQSTCLAPWLIAGNMFVSLAAPLHNKDGWQECSCFCDVALRYHYHRHSAPPTDFISPAVSPSCLRARRTDHEFRALTPAPTPVSVGSVRPRSRPWAWVGTSSGSTWDPTTKKRKNDIKKTLIPYTGLKRYNCYPKMSIEQ